jgi:uncharacterized beta-barrel protein YwiB (DUF1934 family)
MVKALDQSQKIKTLKSSLLNKKIEVYRKQKNLGKYLKKYRKWHLKIKVMKVQDQIRNQRSSIKI